MSDSKDDGRPSGQKALLYVFEEDGPGYARSGSDFSDMVRS